MGTGPNVINIYRRKSIADLKENLKYAVFVATAKALKLCNHNRNPMTSYYELHKLTNRATPAMFNSYKCALLFHKMFNGTEWNNEWLHLNSNVINTSRQTKFMVSRSNNYKCGLNATGNKLVHLNRKIHLDWLNLNFNSYKMKCKEYFLSYNSQ
jgi:hypothetical protein